MNFINQVLSDSAHLPENKLENHLFLIIPSGVIRDYSSIHVKTMLKLVGIHSTGLLKKILSAQLVRLKILIIFCFLATEDGEINFLNYKTKFLYLSYNLTYGHRYMIDVKYECIDTKLHILQ